MTGGKTKHGRRHGADEAADYVADFGSIWAGAPDVLAQLTPFIEVQG